MGRRSAIETIAGIYEALLAKRVWNQKDLADHLELSVRTVRKHLDEMQRSGAPLRREEDHPHVYWSLPKDWTPGGLLLQARDAKRLLELLVRLPSSTERNHFIQAIAQNPSHAAPARELSQVVQVPQTEPAYLGLAQQAASTRTTLAMKYYSAHRGLLQWRDVSVARVLPGPPARMVGLCHRDDTLKWFRIDSITEARLKTDCAYRGEKVDAVDAFVGASVDGYHGEGTAAEHAFLVREPEARWVQWNLPPPLESEDVTGGIRVRCRTAGILPLARFVVGLGGAAHAETPALAELVADLARGALQVHQRAKTLPREGALFGLPNEAGEGGHRGR